MFLDIKAEDIKDFIHVLEKESPNSIFIISFIETCHKWKEMNSELPISLMYTERGLETGVFVGVLKTGRGTLVTLYAVDGYEKDLEEELTNIQIDWKAVVLFEGIVNKHIPVVDELVRKHGLKCVQPIDLFLACMPKDEALKQIIECPDEVEFAPLTEQHADEIYETWVLRDTLSIDVLQNSIRYNEEAAYGVFSKTTGELLARCVRSHAGVIAALQTVEKARRKGYAKLLLKHVAKKIAEKDILPCAYSGYFNLSGSKAVLSSGFKEVCHLRNYEMVIT